ncbi:UNVERIFIED_CONTAM: hypothetical protein GTU68_065867 [Idotea baltica]|nr:hypothetical protein [Idotea baltica]
MQEALHAKLAEPNALTLATATTEGKPSARVVLLKGVNPAGFIFYTNYDSQKGKELVRIEGKVEKISAADSAAYFQSRPKGSQIGALASPQSQVIPDRKVLEDKVQALETTYAGVEKLPCPVHWGGFILQPEKIEFWKGRSSRLHDRLVYEKQGDESWAIVRLAP